MKHEIVKASDLGIRCWLPARFIEGVRCHRIDRCTYAEKKACEAVKAEIKYLETRRDQQQKEITEQIEKLKEELN